MWRRKFALELHGERRGERKKRRELTQRAQSSDAEGTEKSISGAGIAQIGKKLRRNLSRGTGENRAETGRNAVGIGKKN